MSTRYTKVFSLKPNLYSPDSAVIFMAGAIIYDTYKDEAFIKLKIKNISDKAISSISVILGIENGKEPSNIQYKYEGLNLSPDDTACEDVSIPLSVKDAKSFQPLGVEIVFADNTSWQSGEAKFKPIKQKLISSILPDYYQKIAYSNRYGKRAIYVASGNEKLWLCTCGTANTVNRASCGNCQSSKEEFSAIDPDALRLEGALLVAKARADGNTLAELKEAKEAIDFLGDREDLAELKAAIYTKYNELLAKKKKRDKTRNIILFVGIPLVLIAIGLILVFTYFLPKNHYEKGVELYYAGDYSQSLEEFYKVGNFYAETDNWVSAVEIQLYFQAGSYANRKDYKSAYELLRPLSEKFDRTMRSDYYIYKGLATGDYALAIRSGAVEITIPEGVTSIAANEFSGITTLKSITFPTTLTTINASAFSGCTSLEYIYLPESVITIGASAFYNCSNLSVYYEGESDPLGWDARAFPMYINFEYGAKNITYNFAVSGGYPIAPITSATSITLPTPTRDGYRFAGWQTDYGTKITTPHYKADEDITLYAVWEDADYGTKFDNPIILNYIPIQYTLEFGEISIYYLKFYADSASSYNFYSISGYDVDAYIYNENGVAIKSDTKTGNFYFDVSLESGYYYVKVISYNNGITSSCKVNIRKNY